MAYTCDILFKKKNRWVKIFIKKILLYELTFYYIHNIHLSQIYETYIIYSIRNSHYYNSVRTKPSKVWVNQPKPKISTQLLTITKKKIIIII